MTDSDQRRSRSNTPDSEFGTLPSTTRYCVTEGWWRALSGPCFDTLGADPEARRWLGILKKGLDNLRLVDIFTPSARFTPDSVDQDVSQQPH